MAAVHMVGVADAPVGQQRRTELASSGRAARQPCERHER